ncbi:MAG TPA: threonine-phosphate decarboxylase CobD [Leptolyngbyaceae cyanobacterium]
MRQPSHGGNLAWAAAVAGCSADAIVDFSASISPLGPPQSAIAAISSQISNLRHYPDPDYSDLRLALGNFHQLPIEWILPGNGSAELLTLAGRELAQAATILITPAFGDYYRTLTAYNARVLEFPLLSAESGVLSGIQNLLSNATCFKSAKPPSAVAPHHALNAPLPLTAPSTDYALLLNNPHNPTGKLFTRQAILPLLSQFALVVVDEAFMDFVPPDEEQSLIPVVQEYPNLVVLRSLTKFYSLPGLRLGYAIAHPDRLHKWQLWRDPWPVNTLAAAAAIAALKDEEFQAQTWQWLPPARQQLFQGLTSIPGLQPHPSAANFLLVETQQSTVQLQQKLLQQYQILIRDCLSFKELGDRFFRIAVRSYSDNHRLLTALNTIVNS